jgi:hypothetical protein
MEAVEIDTAPSCRDTDLGIRENKLTAVSSQGGVSLRFRTHQVAGLFLIRRVSKRKSPNSKNSIRRKEQQKCPLDQKLSLAEILAAALS